MASQTLPRTFRKPACHVRKPAADRIYNRPVLDELLEETEANQARLEQIGVIYTRLVARLPKVLDRRDEIGVTNGLFEL